MFKVVWVAGMPRSGSMWTFNVTRELIRRAGFRVLPEEVKLTDQECVDYANEEIAANRDPDTIFVLKIHARLASLATGQFVITNIRDVRDVIMSYQRFMRVDFETALEACKSNMHTANHYLAFPEEQRLALRYEELTVKPAETAARIADCVAGGIDDDAISRVVARFSKEKVRALTESKDRQYQRHLAGERLSPGEILLNRPDGSPAMIDRTTGFQSDHVSDYRDGEWRKLLLAGQIRAMEDAFGDWLEQQGYAA